jgi:precorrin-6B methylase 2
MADKSLIDDVQLKREYSDNGPPILFTNAEIRRMLKLARARKDDVLYDLGCGWGQNLIIAATEFGVKKCFGIERLKLRYLKARKRVKQRSLAPRNIIRGQFEDLFEGKIKESNLEDATIVLYALDTDKEILEKLASKLQKGCRLVYYYNALFPEIKPDAVDYPFYVSVSPFKHPTSELDWLRSVVHKKKSSIIQSKKPTTQELWDELYHDYDVMWLTRSDVRDYHRRLKKFLKRHS